MRYIVLVVHNGLPTHPISIPAPGRLILFSPHPDDIAISLGALAALTARNHLPATVALVTDGSEARMPVSFLKRQGWTPEMDPEEQRELRGRIRLREAREEVKRLGFPGSALRVLRRQAWFDHHRTPPEFLFADLSLREVSGFQPGSIEHLAVREIQGLIASETGRPVICAAPDPHDRLLMHRIVTALVVEALRPLCTEDRQRFGLLTYECLTTEKQEEARWSYLGFGEDLMSMKCHAIRAHRSMYERRRHFGGYSNAGAEFYDSIVRRVNSELAERYLPEHPFAERYGWMDRPSAATLRRIRRATGVSFV